MEGLNPAGMEERRRVQDRAQSIILFPFDFHFVYFDVTAICCRARCAAYAFARLKLCAVI